MTVRVIAGRVAAFALLAVFGYIGVLVGRPFADQLASRHWRSAAAIVLRSRVQQDCFRPGSFTNVLAYEYVVDGRRFDGDVQSFGYPFCGQEVEARQRAGAYRVGDRLEVRYDEADPARSVLSKGTLSSGNWLLGAFYLVLLGALVRAVPEMWRGGLAPRKLP